MSRDRAWSNHEYLRGCSSANEGCRSAGRAAGATGIRQSFARVGSAEPQGATGIGQSSDELGTQSPQGRHRDRRASKARAEQASTPSRRQGASSVSALALGDLQTPATLTQDGGTRPARLQFFGGAGRLLRPVALRGDGARAWPRPREALDRLRRDRPRPRPRDRGGPERAKPLVAPRRTG